MHSRLTLFTKSPKHKTKMKLESVLVLLLSLFLISTHAVNLYEFLPSQGVLPHCDSCASGRQNTTVGTFKIFETVKDMFYVSSEGYIEFYSDNSRRIAVDVFLAQSDNNIG